MGGGGGFVFGSMESQWDDQLSLRGGMYFDLTLGYECLSW